MNRVWAIEDPLWEISALEEGLIKLDIQKSVESVINIDTSVLESQISDECNFSE